MTTQKLTQSAVIQLLRECATTADDKNVVIAHMFGNDYALNVIGKEDRIRELLYQLPDEFIEDTGAGHSLLGAIYDKNGEKWANGYVDAQHLLALGVCARMVEELFPPHIRYHLPEGVPYYVVRVRH